MSSFEFFIEKIVTKDSCNKLLTILAGLTIGTSIDPQILPVAAIVAAARESIPIISEIGSSIGEKYLEHVALEPFVKKTWKVFNSKFRGKNDKEIADAVEKLSPQEQMELTLEISKFIEKSMKESVNDERFILNLTNAIISKQEFVEELRKNPELERKVNDLGKDISIKLDEIHKEIKALVEIKLPKVETVLEKEKSRGARFFRPSGPEWIDFKEGFVVERKEVDEIIKQFGNKDLVVIKGNPASGKSVILRNVGYKLVNQGKNAYFIELKKTPLAIEGVLRMNHGYLLIEDVHLNPEYVDDIVRNLHNVKILLSTRGVEGRFGPTSPFKIPEYLKDAIEIKGHDASEGIIQQFSEKKREIPESIRKNLIENNLWILAWELQAYEKYDNIDEDAIYETVKDYIRKDLKTLGAVNAENVFLPLSVFYRYEIPLRKEFVENFSDCRDIEKLIELNEINVDEKNGFEYLTLHHSEIAEIFLKTFQKFDGFGNNIKKKIGGDWYERLFYLYAQEFPKECIDVLNMLANPFFSSTPDPKQTEVVIKYYEEAFDNFKHFGKYLEAAHGKIDLANFKRRVLRQIFNAKKDAEDAKLLIESIKDKNKEHELSYARCLNILALIHFDLRTKNDLAMGYILSEESKNIKEKYGDVDGVADSLNLIGLICLEEGNGNVDSIKKAIEHFKTALVCREKSGNYRGYVNQLRNLGLCYSDLIGLTQDKKEEYFKLAKESYEKCIDYGLKIELGAPIEELLELQFRLGRLHFRYGDMDEAIKYLLSVKQKTVQLGDWQNRARCLNLLCDAYNNRGNDYKVSSFCDEVIYIYRNVLNDESELKKMKNSIIIFKNAKENLEKIMEVASSISAREEAYNILEELKLRIE